MLKYIATGDEKKNPLPLIDSFTVVITRDETLENW